MPVDADAARLRAIADSHFYASEAEGAQDLRRIADRLEALAEQLTRAELVELAASLLWVAARTNGKRSNAFLELYSKAIRAYRASAALLGGRGES